METNLTISIPESSSQEMMKGKYNNLVCIKENSFFWVSKAGSFSANQKFVGRLHENMIGVLLCVSSDRFDYYDVLLPDGQIVEICGRDMRYI